MDTQKIEIYIGWTDGTWTTANIDVPIGLIGDMFLIE